MLRWSSQVVADPRIQEYYVMSCNENLNINYFDISKHPKLQWLCATAVSPGIGTFKHQWIAPKKKDKEYSNKTMKFLNEMYPTLREDELELLASLNTKDDLKDLAKQMGWDDKRIKEYL
jgi:hypothetical protein